MEPIDKNLYDLVKENNTLLRKMNRREQVKSVYGLIKFIVIVVLIIWSYMYVQPYLEKMMELYTNVSEGSEKINDISGSFNFDPEAIRELFAQ